MSEKVVLRVHGSRILPRAQEQIRDRRGTIAAIPVSRCVLCSVVLETARRASSLEGAAACRDRPPREPTVDSRRAAAGADEYDLGMPRFTFEVPRVGSHAGHCLEQEKTETITEVLAWPLPTLTATAAARFANAV